MIEREREYLKDAKMSGCKIEDMELYERNEKRRAWLSITLILTYTAIGFIIGVSYGIQIMIP